MSIPHAFVAHPFSSPWRCLRAVTLRLSAIGILSACIVSGLAGCKELTGNPGLPAGVQNPDFYNTKAGALGMRTAALYNFEQALAPHIVATGLLTDELEDWQTNASVGVLQATSGVTDGLDERILPYGTANDLSDNDYAVLQLARTDITQALGALAAFDTAKGDTASVRTMRSELYALSGYVDIMLADLFCSGVPLSTLQFQKDFTYGASLTTAQVYQAAIATFDSALTLAGTEDSLRNLARVGQGRAYLDMGEYATAADDVALVPPNFQYLVGVQWTNVLYHYYPIDYLNQYATVSDGEGGNGLLYRSSGDPRTADTVLATSNQSSGLPLGVPAYFPRKYTSGLNGQGFAPFVLASGVEARLIQAEAALNGDTKYGNWLTLLNALRTSGLVSIVVPDTVNGVLTVVDTVGYTGCTGTTSCDPDGVPAGVSYASPKFKLISSSTIDLSALDVPGGVVDVCRANAPNRTFSCMTPSVNVYAEYTQTVTVQQPQVGTGGVAGLLPLTDPGTPATQRSLLFTERAAWLFLTGERQGDLRRLVRVYGRPQTTVYPVGVYTAPGTGVYGSDVNAPIPIAENNNPNFHGCKDRRA